MTDLHVPTGLVARIAQVLDSHHTDQLLAPLLTVLGPHARPAHTPDRDETIVIDLALVVHLVRLLERASAVHLLPELLDEARLYLPSRPASQPVAPSVGNPVLSDREAEVLYHVSNGLTNEQVGRHMHLSEHTVKSHNRKIQTKLGVRDRCHAVRRGFELGYLKPDTRAAVAS